MRRFDYTFLKTLPIPGSICNMAMNIVERETAAAQKRTDPAWLARYDALLDDAKMRSVRHSNAIEGIETTEERLSALLSGADVPRGHTERELLGYTRALERIHTQAEALPFTVDNMLALHETMTAPTGDRMAGKCKTEDNVILHITPTGARHVRYQPLSAAETPEALAQPVLAYADAKRDGEIAPLLLIPCVVLDFLCIHPFADGNGRMSRLITLWLLYRHGITSPRYCSLDEKIDDYRGYYYDALHASSVGWHENENDYLPFIEHFLTMLFLCVRALPQ